ncbi:MAG TPA: cytochrome c3 family protein [Anaeromyxobacter sp.]
MKTLAAFAVAFALAFATNASAAAPEKPIVLPAKPGNVTFNHSKHAGAGLKCTTCHKDEKGGAIEGFGATANKDKAHAACHECHKKEGKGPQKCADCHKK